MPSPRPAQADHRSAEIWFRVVRVLDQFSAEQRRYAYEMLRLAVTVYCAHPAGTSAAGWDPRDAAALRTLGHGWALRRWPLDPLLDLLGKVGEQAVSTLLKGADLDPERTVHRLRVLAEISTRLLRDVVAGYQEARDDTAYDLHETTVGLLRGEPMPLGSEPVASAYAVLAFRTTSTPSRFTAADAGLLARDGVLHALCQTGGYLLVPASDETTGLAACTELHSRLPVPSWAGVSWATTAQLPQARAQAVEVVAAALAARRVPGSYRLSDVLVEYAVLTQPAVASLMVSMIKPVTGNAVLLTTLLELLAADGNRTKAATDLAIHRSTLDYRLQRIKQLTGHDPTSARELQALGTALAAHEAATRVSLTLPLDPVD